MPVKLVKILIASMLFIFSAQLIAQQTNNTMENQDKEPTKEILMDKRVLQYTTCSAFYAITQHAVGKQSAELAKQLEDWSYLASLAAIDLIKQSDAENDKAEMFFNSFLQATIDGMKAEIDGDLKNIAVLTNKYGEQCKTLMESSTAVFEKLSKEAKAGNQ
jgi:uncharacterized protein YchJ